MMKIKSTGFKFAALFFALILGLTVSAPEGLAAVLRGKAVHFEIEPSAISPVVGITEIAAVDDYGVETPREEFEAGKSYAILPSRQGTQLVRSGASPDSNGVLVRNDLRFGTVRIRLYQDGKLVFEGQKLAPDQREVVNTKIIGVQI